MCVNGKFINPDNVSLFGNQLTHLKRRYQFIQHKTYIRKKVKTCTWKTCGKVVKHMHMQKLREDGKKRAHAKY